MPNNVAEPSGSPPSQRIVSLDALRGFDMFWIIGGEGFAAAILQFCRQPMREALQPQLSHAVWEGFRFYDLIFPLFVFLVGMSTTLSLSKILEKNGKAAAYWRVLRRTALLYLLGLFYYGGFASPRGFRFVGVLPAHCTVLFVHGAGGDQPPRAWNHCPVGAPAGRLLGMVVVCAAAGAETISFEPGKNWTNYIDAHYLPGWKWGNKAWDPEGLLSTLPAIGTCLLGVLAAELLRSRNLSQWLKACCLIGGGIVCVAAGYCWGLQFPVIKKLWTSSYVLVAGGYSCILMGVFYTIIDIWKLRRWATAFLWIGTNAITLYMAESLLDFQRLAVRLVGGNVQTAIGRLWGGTREAPGGPLGVASAQRSRAGFDADLGQVSVSAKNILAAVVFWPSLPASEHHGHRSGPKSPARFFSSIANVPD